MKFELGKLVICYTNNWSIPEAIPLYGIIVDSLQTTSDDCDVFYWKDFACGEIHSFWKDEASFVDQSIVIEWQ